MPENEFEAFVLESYSKSLVGRSKRH